MNWNNIKHNTILLTVIGCILIFALIFNFKEADKTVPNYATVIGTIGSIIGLAIAYVNIVSLKQSSIELSKKIDGSIKKVNQLNSISEISKAIKTNQEIQIFIRNGKIESAHLRLLDLKIMLLHFNSDEYLNELTSHNTYVELVVNFGIDLNSINDLFINPKRKVDFGKITNNLEELSTYLTQFETRIKTIKI